MPNVYRNNQLTYEYIKPIRTMRNKTQAELGKLMELDTSTVGKLERNEIQFTPFYEAKLKQAIRRLRISQHELYSIKTLIEYKKLRGYKG
ncbi:helix-turn-helix domain-containing protein [Priestia megaterium]|uniref:helix-turn-helix domain-containing protein n=1 Tax=Priestia megaterium TaxID=1404 RepID=UPI0015B25D33|nr:helix-turn-helix transcriptional regulator [Priestia megaterium]QLC85411.1 helix-turn-helix transcriptional regulator [Priestia megaterium]